MNIELEEGVDLTEILDVSLYQPPIPAELAGDVEGPIPGFLNKTDEERIQNLGESYDELKNEKYYSTEKLDGSSATYYFNEGKFGVCGRNWEYKRSETNSIWRFAIENDLENKLKEFQFKLGANLCLQGELIGPGIQGNRYKLDKHEVRFFNVFDIESQEYGSWETLDIVMKELGLKSVPLLDEDFKLPNTIDELLVIGEGKSVLNKDTEREGIVVRTDNKKVSFKVISNKFLLKEK